jgi:hypothetical protein
LTASGAKFNSLSAAGWKIAHLTAAMPGAEMVAAVRALFVSVVPGGIAREKQ